MRKQNVLVLLSGGVDSSACVSFYLEQNFKVAGLFVDYGQLAAKKESSAAKKIASYYKIPFEKVVIKNPAKFSSGNILGRNLFLLSTALLNFKPKNGIICIGIHDGTAYPDCTKKFINDLQGVFDIYKNGAIQIGIPFVSFNKAEVWSFCQVNNVPVQLTYSCERGKNQPCGKCLSCKDLEILYASSK
jgi:7-cyano-7-deazaguanine synthase